MTLAKRISLLILLATSSALISGCVILYMPHTYQVAETSAIAAPFSQVFVEFNTNASDAPLSISLRDSDPAKLSDLRFAGAAVTDEDGATTQLRLCRENLENANSFRMDFYKADYLGHDLHFRVNLLSKGKVIVITFQTRFKSKVVWPKDSDYSG